MSVLAADRKESRYQSIVFAIDLQTRLTDFANRDFGVKDFKRFIQLRYAYGKDDEENYSKYRYLLQDCKTQLNRTAALLTANLVAAKSIYPTAINEYNQRREYQNSASIKGRGMSHARKRFEIHIRKAYREYGSDSYILFGDFKKFYDNIIHKIVKKMLIELVDDDEFISWLLDVIFDGFKIDVSYMTDEEYDACLHNVFDKLKYRQTIPKDILTGEKFMEKSVNIGDQISQIIGIFYPHRIDTYVKFVRSQKYYGRYMDDWYLICRTKEELIDIYNGICEIAKELGIHINTKKTRIVKLCSSYKFLQVKYEMTEDGKLYKKINPKRVVCFRRKIKKLAIKVLEGTSTYENVENTFKSWMGAYYKLLTKVQRENLITLYEDLFNKRIDIVNKKMVITNKE